MKKRNLLLEKAIAAVLTLSLLLGVGLFVLPNLLTTGIMHLTGMTREHYGNALFLNLIEGIVRVIILVDIYG